MSRAGGWSTCLVVGSMVPDLLQNWWPTRAPHSLRGAFLLDLPAALVAGFLLHELLRRRLPRMPGLSDLNMRGFQVGASILASILGIFSHLAWDLFTHLESAHVIAFLWRHQDLLIRLGGRFAATPSVILVNAWYASSLAGVVAIAAYLLLRFRRADPALRRRFLEQPWRILLACACSPFLPLLWEIPGAIIFGTGRRLRRLDDLSTNLRAYIALSIVLSLVAFVAVTARGSERPSGTER